MRLNCYRVTPGKPMVYSMESARKFLEQTKSPLEIYVGKNHYYVIREFNVQLVERSLVGLIGVDFEEWRLEGEDAVKWAYHNRKIINERLR